MVPSESDDDDSIDDCNPRKRTWGRTVAKAIRDCVAFLTMVSSCGAFSYLATTWVHERRDKADPPAKSSPVQPAQPKRPSVSRQVVCPVCRTVLLIQAPDSGESIGHLVEPN